MKHTFPVTIMLLAIFLSSQLMGILILNEYIDARGSSEEGKTIINEKTYNITGFTPPPVKSESGSWVYVLFAVVVGTVLVLLLMKFKKRGLWKTWFAIGVGIALVMALAPFVRKVAALTGLEEYSFFFTFAIACALSIFKILKPNVYIHNITEIFVYGGLAALLVPILNLISVAVILIAVSIYDIWAVWKSKHMVKMAQFQTESKMFAGFFVPYEKPVTTSLNENTEKTTKKSAILGGGDIAFPLLFSGVVFKLTASFLFPILIAIITTLALATLMIKGKSDTFYPAMPFITAGCLFGFFVVWGLEGFSLEWLMEMIRFGTG
ncbi:MAG: presenilin family intramembrane aspartyl protease [Candidatus Woesearchaeota archaeon]